MKRKIRKDHAKKFNLFPLFFLSLLILVFTIILQASNFSKPIPDVAEMPEDVKESIKNTKPQKSFRVPIFMYHYVEYVKDEGDTIRKSLNILPVTFEQEVKTLKDAGFNFITTADLAKALDDKKVLSKRSVILTFDDGYRDFYTDVFPILKKYQAKAVVYVVPNFLNKQNNLTVSMMSELAKSGLVEIGAHTMDHMYLSGLPQSEIIYQVEGSKRYLEKSLGIKVTSFAYPYGAFDNATIDVVKKAGFKTAVTTIDGVFAQDLNRFFLYRIRPGGKVGQALLDLIEYPNIAKSKYQ